MSYDKRYTIPAQSARDVQEDEEYDDEWPDRLPSSSRRYDTTTSRGIPSRGYPHAAAIPQRASSLAAPTTQGSRHVPAVIGRPSASASRRRRPGRLTVLLWVWAAVLVMLAGWWLFSVVANWWQTTQDDWHYGRPRTFQIDAVVGHNDSSSHPSHFIAVNLHRQVLIIELPGGDPSHARIYSGPMLMGQGQELDPVTLSFRDVNGDGKPDMLVTIGDSHLLYINDNGSFRPARAGEGGATS